MQEREHGEYVYMVSGRKTGVDIIPDTIFNYLPFTAEPFSQWGENTDLLNVLRALYSNPLTALAEDGTYSTKKMIDSGLDNYVTRREEFEYWVKQFDIAARKFKPTGRRSKTSNQIPDFYQDALFGKTAKYIIAWDSIVFSILEDSTFFSIAHALESNDDLVCSTHLAAHLYYKQAMQVLRSFIEDLVLPINFFDRPKEFADWKADNYFVPSLRGRDGLLKKLVGRGTMSQKLADDVSDIYGALNGYIHGSEKHLINRGELSNQGEGHTFKTDDFNEWCAYVSRTVEVGIHLLKINVEQWEGYRAKRKVICTKCHNESDFDIETFMFGGQEFTKYSCHVCGQGMTFNPNWEQTYRVVIRDPMIAEVESYHEAIKSEDVPPDDVNSIDSVIKALYEGFSFEPGQSPNWNRLHALFLPGARLIMTKGDTHTTFFDFDSFRELFEESMENSEVKSSGSQTLEITRKTEEFGNIVQAWSTFETKYGQDESAKSVKGVNSIQLVKATDRFWIVNLHWDMEPSDKVASS